MNVLGNTLLQYFTGNPAYDIDVTIHPLPLLPVDVESSETFIDQLAPAMVFSTLNFGISFLLATFVVFVIRVRLDWFYSLCRASLCRGKLLSVFVDRKRSLKN